MEKIVLKDIHKYSNTITYDFSVSEGLSDFFTQKPFVIEYPENIEDVPDAVAAVPFVCNVLPIIWLTDSVLSLNELDKAFFDCIPNVRKGYETMFPESSFAGKIEVDNIVTCDVPTSSGSASLFSGGVDAVNTLVHHLDENPALISVWGSDIHFDNTAGWERVHHGISEYSRKFNLPDVVIRSSFRAFDNEGVLNAQFHKQLKDGWWHGVKHSLGLLGHVAPYAYLHRLSTIYIASTNCPADGPVRCASNPLTDNHVRFVNARVVHDGFEFSRQDKVRNVVEYVQKTGEQLLLHVCWESQSGNNCCQCEKCYRTMVGLIAEGVDPTNYGFEHAQRTISNLQKYLVWNCRSMAALQDYWPHIQKRIIEQRTKLKRHPDWKYIKWMLEVDFRNPESLKMPFNIRTWLSRFRFYQFLHKLKEKIYE